MRVLIVYPNLPLMMSPSMAVALFNSIAQDLGCEVEVFETTYYSDEYSNRHIKLAEVGGVRNNNEKELFHVKPEDQIIPDYEACLERFKPDLILMSVLEDVWPLTQRLLKSSQQTAPIVIGGVFPTAAPEVVMRDANVRYVAIHEGERTVADLITAIQEGEDISTVNGIWWKDDVGIVHKNAGQPLCDITKTIPDYRCFPVERWKRPMGGRMWQRAVSMETYRGCPYNCTFCNSPNTRDFSRDAGTGNFIRRKDAATIAREFQIHKERYNPDFIMFQDDSFLARPEREIMEFCEVWSKHCTPFWFNTRIENCKPHLLNALKEVGLYRMTFGIESGNAEYRKEMLDRNVKDSVYHKYFEYINESNIPYSLNVILGFPYETRDMVLDGARMVKQAAGYDGLLVSMFQPYYGTGLRQAAVDGGFLSEDYMNGSEDKAFGGYMDQWALRMPEPYLQESDVHGLLKTFALYAYYPESMWAEIKVAETDDVVYNRLMEQYKTEFMTEYQMGGADRLSKHFCAKHDPTSSYSFEIVDD